MQELDSGEPEAVALENARRKALAGAPQAETHELVLGVDTLVALEGRIYGKPADEQEARETLRALGGRRHLVLSGLATVCDGELRSTVVRTLVEFRLMDEALTDWYVTTGEWRERAGGYAIQGRGAALVTGIEGDYSNVVGLPVASLLDLHPALLGCRVRG